MTDWASVNYHASSMANGGGYLLKIEKDRLEKLAEITEQAAALKAAEAEALARKAAEERAIASALAAQEAERKAQEEKERAAPEEAARLEAALAAAAAESARLKAEQEQAHKESEAAAARAAAEEAKAKAAASALAEAEAAAAANALEAEAARNKALEEQAEAEAAQAAVEEAEEVAAEAAQAAGVAEAAAAPDSEPVVVVVKRTGRRPSVILNELGDSEDEDEDEKDKVVDAPASENIAESADPNPASMPPLPSAAPEVVAPEAPTLTAPAPAPAPAVAVPLPPKPASAPKVAVSAAAVESAVEEMVLTDALLEACFTNLNGGSATGSLNPMQMSILVRLITKKHNLMQEMTWFSKFDQDGVGGISMAEFKDGFRNIEKTGLVDASSGTSIVSAIKSYVAHSNFAL
jgi:chemotaxis protein histidine kinase CheA